MSDAPSSHSPHTALTRLAEAAQLVDGQPAFSDQTWVELRRGTAVTLTVHDDAGSADSTALIGAAVLSGLSGQAEQSGTGTHDDPLLVEMLVHPEHRGRGHGATLVRRLTERLSADHPAAVVTAWAHGDHPAARRLAATVGLEARRELWKMALPLTPGVHWDDTAPAGLTLRPFVPGQDDEAWLATNAAAFADHPEQGRLTLEDLRERQREDWFSPAGFFVAEDPLLQGAFAGFHWTKIPVGSADGEVYAVGVHPQAQGSGLGRVLTARGLNHLAEQNCQRIVLYVDADNAPAVALYRSLGFTVDETDVMFVSRRPTV
ncbi:MAG: mycothiol synthase [Micrococcaceae bacterium]